MTLVAVFQTSVPAAEVGGRAGAAGVQLGRQALRPACGRRLAASVQFRSGHARPDRLYLFRRTALSPLRPGPRRWAGRCDGVDCVGDTLWTFLNERWLGPDAE